MASGSSDPDPDLVPAASSLPVSGWMTEVRFRLSRWERHPAPDDGTRRRSAVLVPLFVREGGLWALFTLRTESVGRHPGQISFPGGAEDPEDRTLFHTALRESREELGIQPQDVVPLGRLSPIVTVTGFYVEPFVAALPQPYELQPAAEEIAEVIEVPVAGLLRPEALETRPFPGREEPVYFYTWERHVIWGATATMLHELLAALQAPVSAD